MKTIKFAVLGCGGISKSHFNGILASEGAELAAICDVNVKSLEVHAEKYNVPTFDSYEELLKQEEIDVICICTPSGMHAEQTILAARAGKHVICEKPIAIRLEDADRMIQACKENDVKLASVFPRRMSPAAQFVKQLLQEGSLGKLSHCSGYVRFFRSQDYYERAGWRGTWELDGGGALMNQGIHTVDLLQWLAGPVEALRGYAKAVLRNIEVEDTAVAALQFRNGSLGVLEATTTAYNRPTHQIIIHGERGTIILTGDELTTLDIVGETVEIPQFTDVEKGSGHRKIIQDMLYAIRDDREPMISGVDSKHSLEIILGIYESARTNKEMQL